MAKFVETDCQEAMIWFSKEIGKFLGVKYDHGHKNI